MGAVKSIAKISPGIDEYRWLRAKHGNVPTDQIAEQDGVSVEAVQKSIVRVERQRAKLTLRELHSAEMGVLLAGVRREVEALNDAMNATKRVQVLDMRGRPVVEEGQPIYVEVPDHDTRLAAVKVRTDILNAIQPKGGGLSVNMSQQVAVAGGASRRGVESRIIAFNTARERGLALPPQEAQEADVDDDESEDAGEA